jgi:hypothetical protein
LWKHKKHITIRNLVLAISQLNSIKTSKWFSFTHPLFVHIPQAQPPLQVKLSLEAELALVSINPVYLFGNQF